MPFLAMVPALVPGSSEELPRVPRHAPGIFSSLRCQNPGVEDMAPGIFGYELVKYSWSTWLQERRSRSLFLLVQVQDHRKEHTFRGLERGKKI